MGQKYTCTDLEPATFYLRKSREDQEAESRGEGETLAKHKRELFRLASDYSVTITHVFEEIVSGESIVNRPEMIQLLKEVASGKWRSVFCMEVDRLGRGDMEDQGLILKTFKNANTLIVTPRKIYDLSDEFDEEYTEFEAFMARKELKIITRRLQGGRVRSVQDGNYIGTRPPYGYQIKKAGRDRILVPHPDQAPVVQLIFDLYTNDNPNIRMGSKKIAMELNKLGKLTYTGKSWQASTVLFIIKNEVYTGRLQWKKKAEKKSTTPGKKKVVQTRPRTEWIDVAGKHDPLVSKDLFSKAQAILKGKYHVPYQLVNGITNPLAGLVKCAMCGMSMVYRPYSCQQPPHLVCYNTHCANKSSRFEYVESKVIASLHSWLEDYRAQWTKFKPAEGKDTTMSIKKKALQNLVKQLQELDQQKERLQELLEKRLYDETTYVERSQKLAEHTREIEQAVIETENTIKHELERDKIRKDIIPKLEKVLSVYTKSESPAVKNQILKSVLESITYRKEKHQRDDDFTLILHPKVPH